MILVVEKNSDGVVTDVRQIHYLDVVAIIELALHDDLSIFTHDEPLSDKEATAALLNCEMWDTYAVNAASFAWE